MKEVWKMVALPLIALLIGAGGTKVLGDQALNQHKAEATAKYDKLEAKVDKVLETVYKTNGILTTEYAIHHPGDDHTFVEALQIDR